MLGRALLGDGKAADTGPKGIALIEAAAAQDHAEAVAAAALFAAMGAGRPQSWTQALDLLERAAKLGSEQARGQLETLGARGFDPASLLAVSNREILTDVPRLILFTDFATGAECDWAIARAKDRLQRATVFDPETGKQKLDPVRDNSGREFLLDEMDVVLEVLRARISAATRLPVPIFEPVQVLHYSVGQQFREHHDFLDPTNPEYAEELRLYGQRIATVLIYLNDGYEGGETIFPRLGLRFRGKRGDALFFTNVLRTGEPDPMTIHAGTPPTAGEKWIVSQWIRDRMPGSPPPGASTAG